MKSVKVVLTSAVVLLLIVFVAACGGHDDRSDLLRANEQLQEEIERLMNGFWYLMYENSNLQAELKLARDQLAGTVSPSADEKYHEEYPMFHHDLQSLLNESGMAGLGIEHLAMQNLVAATPGMEYILWRGSWSNLSETEHYINLLVQNGWELVNMFGAGPVNGIVVVMRR